MSTTVAEVNGVYLDARREIGGRLAGVLQECSPLLNAYQPRTEAAFSVGKEESPFAEGRADGVNNPHKDYWLPSIKTSQWHALAA
jgi:hypothetical protein